MGGVLAGDGVVDLQFYLNLRELLADGQEAFVNDDGNSGLRNPCEGFWEEGLDAPEEAIAKAESVANLAAGSKLSLGATMPVFNAGVSGEPIALHQLALVDGEAAV